MGDPCILHFVYIGNEFFPPFVGGKVKGFSSPDCAKNVMQIKNRLSIGGRYFSLFWVYMS